MNRNIYDNYVRILQTELVPALGCTEPIALAYAAAKAREVLGVFPERVEVCCSGNIIKNVKGVKVPNSNGLKGVEAAVILGIVGGNQDKELEVLEDISQQDILKTTKLLKENYCLCNLKEGVANLYIEVLAVKGQDSAKVIIENSHINITLIQKNGQVVFEKELQETAAAVDKSLLNIKDIVAFANEVAITDVEEVLKRQIMYNTAIAEEGLTNDWGAQIGKTICEEYGDDVKYRAQAKASAGSDARMSGCSLPVVINSGSGNQGMTCSLPVIEYAKALDKSEEQLYRALCISNLVAQNQKRYIGPLSAYCGVVCAVAGSGAAITYLHDGNLKQISDTIINTIANIGGMVCDGAKPSCAAKIASAVQTAILGHKMAMKNLTFSAGEGLVMDNPEDTVKAIGHMGKAGMKQTDLEILNLMIGKTKLSDD